MMACHLFGFNGLTRPTHLPHRDGWGDGFCDFVAFMRVRAGDGAGDARDGVMGWMLNPVIKKPMDGVN